MYLRDVAQVIFPEIVDKRFRGYRAIVWLFLAMILVGIAVSLIHIFLPDGGSYTFAGINTNVEGGSNIIAAVALWGVSGLMIGVFLLVIVLRYRSLVTLGLLVNFLLYSAQLISGLFKPFSSTHPLPGTLEDYVMAAVSFILFVLSIVSSGGD